MLQPRIGDVFRDILLKIPEGEEELLLKAANGLELRCYLEGEARWILLLRNALLEMCKQIRVGIKNKCQVEVFEEVILGEYSMPAEEELSAVDRAKNNCRPVWEGLERLCEEAKLSISPMEHCITAEKLRISTRVGL